MKTSLKKIGNSRGILIPAKLLDELEWDEGAEIECVVKGQTLSLRKCLPSFDEMIRSVKSSKAKSSQTNRFKDEEL